MHIYTEDLLIEPQNGKDWTTSITLPFALEEKLDVGEYIYVTFPASIGASPTCSVMSGTSILTSATCSKYTTNTYRIA